MQNASPQYKSAKVAAPIHVFNAMFGRSKGTELETQLFFVRTLAEPSTAGTRNAKRDSSSFWGRTNDAAATNSERLCAVTFIPENRRLPPFIPSQWIDGTTKKGLCGQVRVAVFNSC